MQIIHIDYNNLYDRKKIVGHFQVNFTEKNELSIANNVVYINKKSIKINLCEHS